MLPQTTTERLLAVADLIEFTPERWDQDAYDGPTPRQVLQAAGDALCGTPACVAGWAVRLTPISQIKQFENSAGHLSWSTAGRNVLGLDRILACDLFSAAPQVGSGGILETPVEMADALRRLAKLPEGKRDHESYDDTYCRGDEVAS